MISAGGNITSNQQIANTTDETVLITETIYGNTLDSTSMCFRVFIGGEISANAAHDITFTLRYGAVDILELITVTLVAENDKPFKVEYTGHILTAGASAKIVASGHMTVFQTTPMYFESDTPNTGQAAALDLTTAGSLNVTGKWDNANANSDVIATHGWIQFYN
jgi:hypothetical protein